MRYVLQLLVPALVVIVVALVLLRNRGASTPTQTAAGAEPAPKGLSTTAFVVLLIAAALFTVVLVYELQAFD
jgi:hypothetical protein